MNIPQKMQNPDRLKPIAQAFVESRRDAKHLAQYPGEHPADLPTAYAIQDTAIDLWPDEISGWKVGRIPDAIAPKFGEDRLVGPIFARTVQYADGRSIELEAIEGGFAAVEGEFILELSEDAPAGKTDWTVDEARALVGEVYCGIELAGSPFTGINDHGPCVTVSDFGNNAGLIVGSPFSDWRDKPMEDWGCETFIDEELIGSGTAAPMPGGVFESLRFALMRNAERGLPLKKGHLISSGAISGVHEIKIGQSARVVFSDGTTLHCSIKARTS
ncbi:2-keto-4-pentenoate hydratase [Parvularcula flava]|uniref:2-keto-4-pentenoate hydratase n=1 Tax=Aquisalinus luteolus TaxID=1566827 RepID=A0A8J3EPR5_9PROT|nr:2-keto-4-pentenoate hydratase [Aquisalinus luteolus]NHK26439.1 2-keto-4-pentenoate hydratase [Aquisalinus luteolus]GGH92337.1 2-keto-4-pentenoate hydratase [Aquisalinus luteolus]